MVFPQWSSLISAGKWKKKKKQGKELCEYEGRICYKCNKQNLANKTMQLMQNSDGNNKRIYQGSADI